MKWIVILAVLLSMHSNAQKQSLCYEISNEKLGIERSYLFGTMHAMEKNSFFFPKRITKLLEKSDALCLEIKNITEVRINPDIDPGFVDIRFSFGSRRTSRPFVLDAAPGPLPGQI